MTARRIPRRNSSARVRRSIISASPSRTAGRCSTGSSPMAARSSRSRIRAPSNTAPPTARSPRSPTPTATRTCGATGRNSSPGRLAGASPPFRRLLDQAWPRGAPMPDRAPAAAPLQPTRLEDYRPPAFLVDAVELEFDLDPTDTRVATRLTLRRNPEAADSRAPLRLDGDELSLISLALDGHPLAPGDYRLESDGALVIPQVPDRLTLEIATRIAPERNTALSGLYISGGN